MAGEPTFVVIGAGKAGTTALHPNVMKPPIELAVKQDLTQRFRQANIELATLIGRDLSRWQIVRDSVDVDVLNEDFTATGMLGT